MVLILLVNILGFCILFPWWFFAFDLYAGPNWQAFTFGLPLLAGIGFLIWDTVYMVKKGQRKRGLRGTGIGIGAAICNALIIWFFAAYIVGIPLNHAQPVYESEEDRLLALALKMEYGDSAYFAIVDNAYADHNFRNIHEMQKNVANSIKDGDNFSTLGISEETLFRVVGKFIDTNIAPANLTISSSIDGGYCVDVSEKMDAYFDTPLSLGWLGWRLSHPRIGPSVEVSRPFYDRESGIVMVYMGWQADYLYGAGGIFVYRYENGKLYMTNYIELWIS